MVELARECAVLAHERDELQYDNAWAEHEIDQLRTQLRDEQCAHTATDARAVTLWELLKQQTRRLRAMRAERDDAVEALVALAANPILTDHADGTCPGSTREAA